MYMAKKIFLHIQPINSNGIRKVAMFNQPFLMSQGQSFLLPGTAQQMNNKQELKGMDLLNIVNQQSCRLDTH